MWIRIARLFLTAFVVVLVVSFVAIPPMLAQSLPKPDERLPSQVKSPDPFRVPGLPDPSQVSINPNAKANLPSPDAARSMANRALSGINSLTDTVQKNLAMIRQFNQKIGELGAQIDALRKELVEVLEDLRHGHFCSTCGRAKREFGSDRAFWNHIAEGASSGRHAVPASAEQLAAKEKEYKDKIAGLERERSRLTAARNQKQWENQQAWDQIQQGIYLWQAAITLEESLLIAREEESKRQDAAAIKEAEQNLARVESERRRLLNQGPLSKETLDQLEAGRSLWQQVKSRAEEDATRRVSYFWADYKQGRETRIREYTQMTEYVRRTDEYANTLRGLAGQIPGFNISLNQLTKDPILSRFSFSYSPEQLGVRFKFGSLVSSGLTAGETDATTTEVKTFLELFGKVQISAGWRNTTNPYDFSGPTADINILPPKDKPKLTDSKLEEKPKKELPKP